MVKKICLLCLLALCIPYITTLAFTGVNPLKEIEPRDIGEKRVVLDRGGSVKEVDLEDYLLGILAKQIDPSYEPETLKAQAIIARTYLYKQMGQEDSIAESALDLDYLEANQMEQLWGKDQYLESYKKLETAIKATASMVIQYEGALIDPLFHKISAGKTRTGDQLHPYLQSVDSLRDMEADSYLTVTTLEADKVAKAISQISQGEQLSGDQLFQTMQILEKDDAGYILSIQMGTQTYTGEQVQYALYLPSSCFSIEPYEQQIRFISKGHGHGYGFSQYGANEKAKEGWTAQELLQFYYKNIVVISE